MKTIYFFLALALGSCTDSEKKAQNTTESGNHKPVTEPVRPDSVAATTEDTTAKSAESKPYTNTHFKDVTVTKTAANTYKIKGKGQIFEANFGWVVEDGHNELQTGHQMTDAGAPEWGNFEFTVTAKKDRPNSTLTLILFEISAKDGSRQYELPLPLH